MNSENKTIHEFDFSLICEYFLTLERQGPGSPEVTKKALSFIDNLTKESQIVDIGCGTGGQTMVLAQNAPGFFTGVDLFPDFITRFRKNAVHNNLQDRMEGIVGSMDQLPFTDEQFDLIWSEGAIYNIGFKKGLNEWRRFLKPGAYLAVTEASWFRGNRPAEIEDFWEKAYPEIDTISANIAVMEDAGYQPTAAFILPENCWEEHFYEPQVKAQEAFLEKYAGNITAQELVSNQKYEAQLYHKYKSYYGYVFYIGRKI